jgi:hypothetical protein
MLVAPPLEWAEANQTCVHGFPNLDACRGHWNEHGHRLAGETIAAWLRPEIMVRFSALPMARLLLILCKKAERAHKMAHTGAVTVMMCKDARMPRSAGMRESGQMFRQCTES